MDINPAEELYQAQNASSEVGNHPQQERARPNNFQFNRNFGIRGQARGRSRNRGNERFRGTSRRHGCATYALHTTSSTSLMAQPDRMRFPIYVSNVGINDICDRIYDLSETRDHRLGQYIARDLLKYIVGLAWCNRIVQVSISTATAVPPEASLLKASVGGILLPPLVCDYIESFGVYSCASGVTLVPRSGPIDVILSQENGLEAYDHRLAIPLLGDQLPGNHWGIVPQIIDRYNAAVSRSNRSGMVYRTVSNIADGQSAMICSYEQVGDRTIGRSVQTLPEPECQLGAAYRLRNYANRAIWPGDYNHLINPSFSTRDFRITELHSERILSLMLSKSTQ